MLDGLKAVCYAFAMKKIAPFLAFALAALVALASCTNQVDAGASGSDVVGMGCALPDSTGIASCNSSAVYNSDGKKELDVTTFFLQGWEDIPFLRLADIAQIIGLINECDSDENYLPRGQEGLYAYKYDPAKAGPFADDTLYFDAKSQTIYSDDFTRIITPDSFTNNGIGSVFVSKNDSASKKCPKVTFSDDTASVKTAEYVKGKERTTINLASYGLKMFVFDSRKFIDDGLENDLFIPFQVIADTFLRYSICSYNGTDYYVWLNPEDNGVATRKAYESGRDSRSTRSQLKAEFNYRNLCLLFDRNYCLKEQRTAFGKDNIAPLINDSIFVNGLGFDLLSTDTATYDAALAKFLMSYIDDGHTDYIEPSMYQSAAAVRQFKLAAQKATGPRNKKLDLVNADLLKRRTAAGGKKGVFYVEEGGQKKMAVIVFDGFEEGDPGSGPWTDLDELASTNTYQFFEQAFIDIAKYASVKNVAIDLSCNFGGAIQQCMAALCYLEDPTVFYLAEKNHLDNSIAKFYCSIQDDAGRTSLKKSYNFYVLTSESSFSCGNFFPSICKYQLNIPVVGQRSGGGGGVVKQTQTSDGALFQTSASAEMCALDANGNYICIDDGVPVDLEIPYEKFYSGDSIYKDLYETIKADPRYTGNF